MQQGRGTTQQQTLVREADLVHKALCIILHRKKGISLVCEI
jgi:hypothetical protein